MKKVKLTGKLSLQKETITKLNDEQMSKIQGGGALFTEVTCIVTTTASPFCCTGSNHSFCC